MIFKMFNIYASFDLLHNALSMVNHPYDVVRGWCKEYCDKHWPDDNLTWNISSMDGLFNMLTGSSYHNPFNPGLLKRLANKSRDIWLICCVKNYEKKGLGTKLDEMVFTEIKITGNNVSEKESDLIVETLLENKMTVGQLWNYCTPRLTKCVLILDASEDLLKFYYSVKVYS